MAPQQDRQGIDDAGGAGHVLDNVVWHALATLPRRQRAILALRFYDDRSDAQIAEILGVSQSSVRAQASRGIATLREHLSSTKAKDRFRRDLGGVAEAYQEVARRLGIMPEAGPADLKGPHSLQ